MKAATQRRLRQLHFYLGVFFAPMIFMFAFSGAFQTFRLNEPKGYGGTPPQWMVVLASVHKNQALPRARAAEHDEDKPKAKRADAGKDEVKKPGFALKVFTGLLGIGLMISTLLGVWIALASRAMRSGAIVMLIAGTAVPIWMLIG